MRFSSLIDKSGTLGAIVAAMGCASCFPAIAALGASVGLGFLGHYEGLFINTLLPVFAGIALGANILSFFSHRIWYRLLAGTWNEEQRWMSDCTDILSAYSENSAKFTPSPSQLAPSG
jgi:hypothetical protein